MFPRSRSRGEAEPDPPSPERELERVLTERRTELEAYAARFEETALDLGRREEQLRDERASVERLLRRTTTELEAREKELVEFERELRERDGRLAAAEAELARRRSDLGAVELKRAALEQRERALEGREEAVASKETRAEQAIGSSQVSLHFVPGPAYRLVEADPCAVVPGAVVEVEGVEYVVTRVGRSPLPGDPRPCAYLVLGAPRRGEPGGSS